MLAGVLVRCESHSLDAFTDLVVAMPEVTYASSLLGRADFYIQVICADNDVLWDVVRRMREIARVRETETLLEMQVHKFTYRDVASPGRRRAGAIGAMRWAMTRCPADRDGTSPLYGGSGADAAFVAATMPKHGARSPAGRGRFEDGTIPS